MPTEETKVDVTANPAPEKKEEPFKITNTPPVDFGGICTDKYLKGAEFAKIVNDFFKLIYADFYGATFDTINGSNKFMISLYFDHDAHGENDILAISKVDETDEAKNATLTSLRRLYRRTLEGDKYHLTNKGKDGIKDFLMDQRNFPSIYKSSGYNKVVPDWGKIVTEVSDGTYGNFARQLTKVSFLDCEKLAALIWGDREDYETDDPDDVVEYGVRIVNSFSTYVGYNANPEYLLEIKRISRKHITELCQSFGIGIQHGLNIIR